MPFSGFHHSQAIQFWIFRDPKATILTTRIQTYFNEFFTRSKLEINNISTVNEYACIFSNFCFPLLRFFLAYFKHLVHFEKILDQLHEYLEIPSVYFAFIVSKNCNLDFSAKVRSARKYRREFTIALLSWNWNEQNKKSSWGKKLWKSCRICRRCGNYSQLLNVKTTNLWDSNSCARCLLKSVGA